MGSTSIEWTDRSINPIRARSLEADATGHWCEKVSPGCANCYASRFQPRFGMHPFVVSNREKVQPWIDTGRLHEVLNRKTPAKWFWCDMTDLFGDWVEDAWIDQCFAVMALAPTQTHQLLTKRPERMREYLSSPEVVKRICKAAYELKFQFSPDRDRFPKKWQRWMCNPHRQRLTAWTVDGGAASDWFKKTEPDRVFPSWIHWPLPNVWLGVSVENQKFADRRRADFEACPAAVKYVSYEPALGPVDWNGWEFVQQIISGGESGDGARPSHPDWHRRTRDFCVSQNIAYFFKQWGAWRPISDMEDAGDHLYRPNRVAEDGQDQLILNEVYGSRCTVKTCTIRYDGQHGSRGLHLYEAIDGHLGYLTFHVGKKAAGRMLDGQEWSQFPASAPIAASV